MLVIPLLVIPLFEILFLLLFFGMIGATVFYALQERKSRVRVAKGKPKSPALDGPAFNSNDQVDGFATEEAGQFDFRPDDFKK